MMSSDSQPSVDGQGSDGTQRTTTTAHLKAGLKRAIYTGKSVVTGREVSPDENQSSRPASENQNAAITRSNPTSSLASPTLQSPTSSLIFERNVQDPVSPHDPTPAIPAHIKNEDRIPPALEASSLAITDARLNPDEVEIVTHAAHQPAATTMSENMTSSANLSEPYSPASFSRRQSNAPSDVGAAASTTEGGEDAGLNYASLDPNDVRRLSFISFADVVQGEHVETGGISAASPTSGSQTPASNKLLGLSPALAHPVSPTMHSSADAMSDRATSSGGLQGHQHGELAIETMRQALRKTTSTDLAGIASPVKSQSMSPTRGGRSP